MSSDHHHNLGLELGLGSQDHHPESKERSTAIGMKSYDHLRPSDLTLGPVSPSDHRRQSGRVSAENSADTNMLHRQASSLSAASSFTNSFGNISAKREREVVSGEEVETTTPAPRVISGEISDPVMEDDQDHGSPRKKLRLTKQQSNLLEDSFKEHSTLNPKQKQELAKRLNLRPRQVEVWFQNRRARTKLKQTEADYEQWKKSCEVLTEENKRLQKELHDLKSLNLLTAPFYMPFSSSAAAAAPPANLTICPSCERRGGGDSTTRLLIKPKATHFISNSYTTSTQHPSEAAC